MRFVKYYRKLNIYLSLTILTSLIAVLSALWIKVINPFVLSENKHLIVEMKDMMKQQKLLKAMLGQPHTYVYQDQMQTMSPREVVQKLLKNAKGVTLTSFKNKGIKPVKGSMPMLASLNSSQYLNLVKMLYRNEFEMTLTGDFKSILQYMKNINEESYPIYWESMEYQVDYYPKSKVTLKAFTLRDSK